MGYIVKFNTIRFKGKDNRKQWEDQLKNDFTIAINGKSFKCKNEKELLQRLKFISHSMNIEERETYRNNVDNHIILESEKYGTQKVELSMYGMPQGYVDIDKVIGEVNKEGSCKIDFNRFYDSRQGKFFEGCCLEIIKEQSIQFQVV